MTPLREFFARISSAVRRDHLKREFEDELATHLEMLIGDARQRGLSEADARYEALRKLGQPVSLREQHHDARGFPLLDALVNDSRFAIRMLLKTPAFTVVVTLTLALGIGANTALFSIVDNLLLRSLPVRDPDRLVQLQVVQMIGSVRNDKPLASLFDRAMFLGITTLSEASNQSIAKERMVAVVSGFFGLLGLSLACMGIFGVAAGSVTHRTKELGIRRALGASGKSVIWACLRETLVVLMVGLIIGAVCAAALVRVSASVVNDLLFGITATDITNLIAAIALMVVVALAACTLPALRATRIDPLAVLKEE